MTRHRYLAALVDGGGNVPPELSAVRRLVERGHAVTVLGEDSIVSEIRSTGAGIQTWTRAPNRVDRRPENDLVRDWECNYPWQLVDRLVETMLIGPAWMPILYGTATCSRSLRVANDLLAPSYG